MASPRKWYPIVVVAATFVVSAIAYPRLPDRVPTHWNLHGQIDGYGSRLVATVMRSLIVIGNAPPRVRPNWWFGIRTPWTLSNDRVWERTHRVSGYVFVALGVLALVALVLPVEVTAPAMGVIGLAAALWSIGYSYYVYRQETLQ